MDTNKPKGPLRFVNYISMGVHNDHQIDKDGIKTLLKHQNLVFNKVAEIKLDKRNIYTCCDESKDQKFVDFKVSPNTPTFSYKYCNLRTDNKHTIKEKLPFINVSNECGRKLQHGYKVLKHSLRIFNLNGNKIDTLTHGSNEFKIKGFTINGKSIVLDGQGITLDKTIASTDVYVYFYDKDPRPMLVCFKNKSYACKSLDSYMTKWDHSKSVSDCDCFKDKSVPRQLLSKLQNLSMIFNPVKLGENIKVSINKPYEYTIHEYPPGHIKNKITKKEFNCYLMFKHTPSEGVDKGYRLGQIKFDGTKNLNQINYDKSLEVQSVSIYYYKHDIKFELPLMFVICTKGQSTSSLYYKLTDKSTKSYTKEMDASRSIDPDDQGTMSQELDQVMYNINKTVSLVLKQKSPYEAKIFRPMNPATKTSVIQDNDNGKVSVTVEECFKSTTTTSTTKYSCYVHKLTSLAQKISDDNMISGLRLFLWSNGFTTSSQQQINLYNNTSDTLTSNRLTLYYTSCKGDVCVYFYGDDPRPLMVCYNGVGYVPKDLENYDQHWIKSDGITKCNCSGSTFDLDVLSKLDDVCMYLNPVRIEEISKVHNDQQTYSLQKFDDTQLSIKITKKEVNCYYQYIFEHDQKLDTSNYRLGQIAFNGKDTRHNGLSYDKSKPLKKVVVYFYQYDTNHTEPWLVILDFNGNTTTSDGKEYYKLSRPTSTDTNDGINLTWERENDLFIISKISTGDSNTLEQYLDELRYTFKNIFKIEMSHNKMSSYQLMGRDENETPGNHTDIDPNNKIVVEECIDEVSKQLPGQGYKCLKHKISDIKGTFDYKQIAGVLMTLPGQKEKGDLEIPIYGQSTQGTTKSQPLKLLYNKCMGDVYIYFYNRGAALSTHTKSATTQQGDGDTVPLMLYYNSNYYRPTTKSDYFTKWERMAVTQPKGVVTSELNKVNRTLNEVLLDMTNVGGYGIMNKDNQQQTPGKEYYESGGFSGKRINVTISKVSSNDTNQQLPVSSDSLTTTCPIDVKATCETLYLVVQHCTSNKGPIGTIKHNDQEVYVVESGTAEPSSSVISTSETSSGYKPISNVLIGKSYNCVRVYYHKCDGLYGIPLLLEFGTVTTGSTNTYTDTTTSTTLKEFYERVDAGTEQIKFKKSSKNADELTSPKDIADYIDQVNYNINYGVKIKLEEKPTTDIQTPGTTTYPVELCKPELTGSIIQVLKLISSDPTKTNITVTKPQPLATSNYKYVTHTIKTSNGNVGGHYIGHLQLTIPGKTSGEKHDIKLFNKGQEATDSNTATTNNGTVTLYYNSCTPMIYVYFYNKDPRPLMVCYERQAYAPFDIINYCTKWVKVSELEKCDCLIPDSGSDEQLIKQLDQVVAFLNQVKLETQPTQNSYTIQQFNGKDIKINVTSSQGSTRSRRSLSTTTSKQFCYIRTIHEATTGHRLGILTYNNKSICLTDHGTEDRCISASDSQVVVVYYYKHDDSCLMPLFVALCDESLCSTCNFYYELKGPIKGDNDLRWYTRKGETVTLDVSPGGELEEILDRILGRLTKSLAVQLEIKGKTYQGSLCDSNTLSASATSSSSVDVDVSESTLLKLKEQNIGYNRYVHKVSSISEKLDHIGSIMFELTKGKSITCGGFASYLNYTTCKGDVCVYFYGSDPRPLMFTFDGKTYKAKSMDDYDSGNWTEDSFLADCVCTTDLINIDTSYNTPLLNALLNVSLFLNPVDLSNTTGTYTIHKFNAEQINVSVTQNGLIGCYCKYTQKPQTPKGYRLGTVGYNILNGVGKQSSKLDYITNGETQKPGDTTTDINFKYKPLTEVSTYFYEHDKEFKDPLLVELSFTDFDGSGIVTTAYAIKKYYKLVSLANSADQTMTWEPDTEAQLKVSKGNDQLSSYLDEIRYPLKKNLQILLHKQEPYDLKAAPTATKPDNGLNFENLGADKPITVQQTETPCKPSGKVHGQYQCFKHQLTEIDDEYHYDIAGLRFTLPGTISTQTGPSEAQPSNNNSETPIDVSLYMSSDASHQDIFRPVYYNKCMGNVCVFFYQHLSSAGQTLPPQPSPPSQPTQLVDKVPLMFFFNDKWYKPESRDQYYRWVDITNDLEKVTKDNYHKEDNCQKLYEMLHTVNKDLNQIDIDKTKDDHYGLPSDVQGEFQKVTVATEFTTARVKVTRFKGINGGEQPIPNPGPESTPDPVQPESRSSGTTSRTDIPLYYMVKHRTVNFGSIGKLMYNSEPVQYQNQSGGILTLDANYNYVNVYYHRCDHQYVLPLLLGVGEIMPGTVPDSPDSGSTTPNINPVEFYERVNVETTLKFKKVDDSQPTTETDKQGSMLRKKLLEIPTMTGTYDPKTIGDYVNYINSKINKGVKVRITQKPKDSGIKLSHREYSMELISTEGDHPSTTSASITVSGPVEVKGQTSSGTTSHNKFKCYIHNIKSTGDVPGISGGSKDIGQLILYIPGQTTKEQQLTVFDNVDNAKTVNQQPLTDISTTIFFASCDPIVYVYFYGDDPRPLLVSYNNKAYVPYDIENYSTKWVVSKTVTSTCECSTAGTISPESSANSTLLKELERVSNFLNPVKLDKINGLAQSRIYSTTSYIVQLFNGKTISIKLSIKPSYGEFCYNKYTFTHMGTNIVRTAHYGNETQGFRLGTICYKSGKCIQVNEVQLLSPPNTQECITANGASEVVVYYYKDDTRLDNPLLVVLKTGEMYKPYYELENTSGTGSNTPKLYKKHEDKPIELSATKPSGELFTKLDQIQCNISKSLQVVLSEQDTTYNAKLVDNNNTEPDRASPNGGHINVTVKGSDTCRSVLLTNKYTCYQQMISSVSSTELVNVGALKLLLYSNQETPIRLGDSSDPIYYTTCKGNVYVCFYNPNGASVYTSSQPNYHKVPLLFYFNGNWYKPSSRNDYFTKWTQFKDLKVDPTSRDSFIDQKYCPKLLEQLDIVNRDLNQIDLNHPISGDSKTTESYGLGKPDPLPKPSTDFPTDRVKVTVYKKDHYTRVVHRTTNSFTIGPITYGGTDITKSNGITINGTTKEGGPSTTISIDNTNNHKDFVTKYKTNTVVAYYSNDDIKRKLPQLIVLITTKDPIEVRQQTIISSSGTKYGYYVLSTNSPGNYKYEWRTDDKQLTLNEETEFKLLNGIVILLEKREEYQEQDISAAVKSVKTLKPPGNPSGINRFKNKTITVREGCKTHGTGGKCEWAKKYGYKLFEHDITELVQWPSTNQSSPIPLIGGLRFLIPSRNSSGKYEEMTLYPTQFTRGAAPVERLYYSPKNNKIYVWFYGDDPRPLLLCYNGIGYSPNDKNHYFTQWVNANLTSLSPTLKDCGCFDSQELVEDDQNKLLHELDKVVKFLNTVDLKQVGTGSTSASKYPYTYEVHKFNGQPVLINVKSSTVGDTSSSIPSSPFLSSSNTCTIPGTKSCYKKFEHTPAGMNNDGTTATGYRLGEINYYLSEGNPIQLNYGVLKTSYKYNPLLKVTVFYYDKDRNHKDPLLIELEFKTNCVGELGKNKKEYYKLKTFGNSEGTGMSWEKDDYAKDKIDDPHMLVDHLDGIRYSLKKVLRIEIHHNSTTHYNLTSNNNQLAVSMFNGIGSRNQIEVVKSSDPGYPDLERKGYVCFQHKVSSILESEQYEIGGLAMTLPGKTDNEPVEIPLFDKNDQSDGHGKANANPKQLTYNTCMGDIYVCFYNRSSTSGDTYVRVGDSSPSTTNTDTVPLMLWYNGNWYKPKSRDDYFTKWIQVKLLSGLETGSCKAIDFTHLVSELNNVNKELNRIDLDGTSVSKQKYGLPEKSELSHSFKKERIIITSTEGPSEQTPKIYKQVVHKTVNGFHIGEIWYEKKDITISGIKINGISGGDESISTTISINSNNNHSQFVTTGTPNKPNTVVAYYHTEDANYTLPQLIVLLDTKDEIEGAGTEPISATPRSNYGYYVLATDTGGSGYKYEWRTVENPQPYPFKLNDTTELSLLNSVIILVEKKTPSQVGGDSTNSTYGEGEISNAVKKAIESGSFKCSPGITGDDINRLKGKEVIVKDGTAESIGLSATGFRAISHDMSSMVKLNIKGAPDVTLIASLRFIIPTPEENTYRLLKLDNYDNKPVILYHQNDQNYVYVFFYGVGTDDESEIGGSNGDPRPLLLCYANKAYRATSMFDYDNQKWTKDTTIKNCLCKSPNDKEVLSSILKVSNFLNPVQIEKVTRGTYEIHRFNGLIIKIDVTVKQSDNKFCYNKYTHKPNEGFRLGIITYNNQWTLNKDNPDKCIDSLVAEKSPFDAASEVVVYYYQGDKTHKNPLLVALCKESSNGFGVGSTTTTNCTYQPYYELQKSHINPKEPRLYRKKYEFIALEEKEHSVLEKTLNNIRILIGTILRVILNMTGEYQVRLYIWDGKNYTKVKTEVENYLPSNTKLGVFEQTSCKQLSRSGYKCFKHDLMRVGTGDNLIAGLRLFVWDDRDPDDDDDDDDCKIPQPNTQNNKKCCEIKLYDACNKGSHGQTHEINPLAYTTCKGDLYVYFYCADPRPMLVCYNGGVYCAKNMPEYTEKWCHATGVDSCNCGGPEFQAEMVLQQLYNVSMFLNPVRLDECINAYQRIKGEIERRRKEQGGETSDSSKPFPEYLYTIQSFAGKNIQMKVQSKDLKCY